VHREVCAPVVNRSLDLNREDTFATDLRDRHILAPIALGLDRDKFNRQSRLRCDQECRNVFGLPQRQWAAAGSSPKRHSFRAASKGAFDNLHGPTSMGRSPNRTMNPLDSRSPGSPLGGAPGPGAAAGATSDHPEMFIRRGRPPALDPATWT